MKFSTTLFSYFVNKLLTGLLFSFAFLFVSSFSSNAKLDPIYKEKVYVHLDKPYYTSGEDIWFSVYLVNASKHQPNVFSKVVYVDLIDPLNKKIASRPIKIENQSSSPGDFKLPASLASGIYTIRAYTNFMRNFDEDYFFTKKIYIHNLNPDKFDPDYPNSKTTSKKSANLKPDLQFFPEGGYMVNTFLNRIGFKATGDDGKGIEVTGEVRDEYDTIVARFNTTKFGLGFFGFTPEQGKTYKANINHNNTKYTYLLPEALNKGVVMQVNEFKDQFTVNLQSSFPQGLENLTLIGKQGGEIVCNTLLDNSKAIAIVNISKEFLTQGITLFTLYNENNAPLCERLVFVKKDDSESFVNVTPSKSLYNKGELIDIDIDLEKPTLASMSVSITNPSTNKPNTNNFNIKSYFLLSSELRGAIEQPNYYFESDELQRKRLLDLLMMTQGWRRYIWNELDNDNTKKLKYAAENGFSFIGNIKDYYNHKKSAVADVSLSFMNKTTLNNFETKTDSVGRFEFGDFDIYDPTTIIIRAKKMNANKKKPFKDYFIEIDSLNNSETILNKNSENPFPEFLSDGYISQSAKNQNIDSLFNDEDYVKLNEVNLKSIKKETTLRRDKKRAIYTDPTHTLDFDEDTSMIPYNNPLRMLQNRFPGIVVIDDIIYLTRGISTINGPSPARLYINGVPTENDGTSIGSISVFDVDFIDVIKGPKAAVFGLGGSTGIVAIYLKDGYTEGNNSKDKEESRGLLNFTHPGYYKAREFYTPMYNNSEQPMQNLNTTLYWNPTIKLNEQGKAKISFYASGASTTYKLELEGITNEGIPFTKESFINIDTNE